MPGLSTAGARRRLNSGCAVMPRSFFGPWILSRLNLAASWRLVRIPGDLLWLFDDLGRSLRLSGVAGLLM